MSTTRERREDRAARLDGWADKREARAAGLSAAGDLREEVSGIPMGQPILVGHHSQRRHECAIKRANAATRRAIENGDKAASMRSRAANITAATDASIFSDDADAAEALTARIAKRETERDAMKAANAVFRREHKADLAALSPFMRGQALPYPPYALTNIGASIRRDRARLAALREAGATA